MIFTLIIKKLTHIILHLLSEHNALYYSYPKEKGRAKEKTKNQLMKRRKS